MPCVLAVNGYYAVNEVYIAFIHKGKHLICGFNLDINEGAMDYRVYAEPERFYIGIIAMEPPKDVPLPSHFRLEGGIRKIQGVNRDGLFAVCLNNMNFAKAPFRLAEEALPIDQLMDDCISGRITVEDARRLAHQKELAEAAGVSVHQVHGPWRWPPQDGTEEERAERMEKMKNTI